jgi:hypothetical protein
MHSSTLSSTLALDGGGWWTPNRNRFTPGKTCYQLYKRLGGAPRPVWTGAENFASTGIRSTDRPARSESLHRLSYPNPHTHTVRCRMSQKYIILYYIIIWLSHRSGNRQPKTYVKPEPAITVFELLMMGGVSPETCWAIKKHWNNKFYYTVASSWFFLWDLYYDARIHEHHAYNYLINWKM